MPESAPENSPPDPSARPAGGPKPGLDLRGAVFLAVTVAGLWLLWSWSLTFHHALLLYLWPASVALVVWLVWRVGLLDTTPVPLELTPRTLRYVPWLAWQVVISCVEVLRWSWLRHGEIRPKSVVLPASQRTEVGLVTYANSITLTPGTLSMKVDEEARTIKVHCLSPSGAESLREGSMDRWATWVEGGASESESLADGSDR